MLGLAVGWRDDTCAELTLELKEYVRGYGRPGDHGIVAMIDGDRVGAAWYRRFGAAAPGYGYVRDDIPELALAVERGARRRGVASALLLRLLADARVHGFPGVSLSVRSDNPARELYARFDFVETEEAEGSATMVRFLNPGRLA